jgi:hypothetical protein
MSAAASRKSPETSGTTPPVVSPVDELDDEPESLPLSDPELELDPLDVPPDSDSDPELVSVSPVVVVSVSVSGVVVVDVDIIVVALIDELIDDELVGESVVDSVPDSMGAPSSPHATMNITHENPSLRMTRIIPPDHGRTSFRITRVRPPPQ